MAISKHLHSLLLSFCLILLATCSAFSQTNPKRTIDQYETDIEAAGKLLLRDTSLAVRQKSSANIKDMLMKALKLPDAFAYPFDSIHSVSILKPADATFRIFTWQLFVNNETYKYDGVIEMANGKLFPLTDGWDKTNPPEYKVMAAKNWYGALYYGIYPFTHNRQQYYALFGFDGYSFFSKRKIMEVLQFDNGRPKFGARVIHAHDGFGKPVNVTRFMIEYSAEVSVRLNFDKELNMVVYDNLILTNGNNGRDATNYPDGSYSGFRLSRKGEWDFVDDVFSNIPALHNGEAPIPYPKKDRGLFKKGK